MNSTYMSPFNHFTWSEKIQPQTSNAKACLFNLIIYTCNQQKAAYFQDVARMITNQFPSRVIFIWGDLTTKQPFIKTQQAVETNSGQPATSDYFLIETSKDYLNRVPFIVFPYLIPDIPVYLLWGEDLSKDNIILPQLQKFATRLIYDSDATDNLYLFSKLLLKRLENNHIEVTDMNWVRIAGWRETITKTFDSQERLDQLASTKLVTITYNSRATDLSLHPSSQSFLLHAWLANQLKWKFKKMEKDGNVLTLHYLSAQHPVEVKIQGESRNDLPAPDIFSVEISDQNNFLYSLSTKVENQVIVHCNTIDRCELPFNLFLPSLRSARTFMQEIFYKKTDNQYFNMLRHIRHFFSDLE